MDHSDKQPPTDFDAFLQEAVQQSRKSDEAELFRITAEQEIVTALESRGVHMLVGLKGTAQEASTALFIEDLKARETDNIEQAYFTSTSLQAEMGLNEYVKHTLKNLIIVEFHKQNSLIHSSLLIMAMVQTDAEESTELHQILTHEKKRLIAKNIVQSTIQPGDAWYESMNEVIPGEAFDPATEDGQSYLAEALTQYAQGEALRLALSHAAPEIVRIAIDAFGDRDNDSRTIDTVINSAPIIVSEYLRGASMGDAYADELTRSLNGPASFSQELKRFGQTYALEIRTEQARLREISE